MEFNKKVDPPQSNNNMKAYDKAVAAGKEKIVIQGYKYVLATPKKLIPQVGLIAELKDFVPFDKKTNISGNVNMNRFYAYAEAMYYLFEHNDPAPVSKKDAKKAQLEALKAEKEIAVRDAELDALKGEIAALKAKAKKKGKKPASKAEVESEDDE